jgi:hypothetical protein
MKRRRFLQTIAAAPIASTALAQQPAAAVNPAAPVNAPSQPGEEVLKVESSVADAAAEMVPAFFNAEQFAVLRRLSDILMPPIKGAPGALEAKAPEFLDFLIGASPSDRQQLYRAGLDALNAQAQKRFTRPFAEVDAAQAGTLLAPLRQPWTFDPPADPLARFLQAAKQDVRAATMNSAEWIAAGSSGGRRAGGIGQYWYSIE